MKTLRSALTLLVLAASAQTVGCAVAPGGEDATQEPARSLATAGHVDHGDEPVVGRGSLVSTNGVVGVGGESIDTKIAMWALKKTLLEPLEAYIGKETGDRLIDAIMGSDEKDYTENFKDIDGKLDELRKTQDDINTRVVDLSKQLSISTAYLAKISVSAPVQASFDNIDRSIRFSTERYPVSPGDTIAPSTLAFYTSPTVAAADKAKASNITRFTSMNTEDELLSDFATLHGSIIGSTVTEPYFDVAAKYLALSATRSGQADAAMAMLEAQYLSVLSHETSAMKLLATSLSLGALNGTADDKASAQAEIGGKRSDLRRQVSAQADAFLRASGMLAGMLGSNSAHNTVSDDGRPVVDAHVAQRLARAAALADLAKHLFDDDASRSAFSKDVAPVLNVAILTRGIDDKQVNPTVTSVVATTSNMVCTGRRPYSGSGPCPDHHSGGDLRPATCCAGYANETVTYTPEGVDANKLESDSNTTAQYGILVPGAGNDKDKASLVVSGSWRIVNLAVPLPKGTSTLKAHVDLSIGGKTLALDLVPADGEKTLACGAVDLRYATPASQLGILPFRFEQDHKEDARVQYSSYFHPSNVFSAEQPSVSVRMLAQVGAGSDARGHQLGKLTVSVAEDIAFPQVWSTTKTSRTFARYNPAEGNVWWNSCHDSLWSDAKLSRGITFGDISLRDGNNELFGSTNCSQSSDYKSFVSRFPDGASMENNLPNIASTHEDENWEIKAVSNRTVHAGTTEIVLDAGYNAGSQNAAQLLDVSTTLGSFNVYIPGSGT